MAKYAASISQPMKPKPSRSAALPVDPLPMNGSNTTPPGGVTRRVVEALHKLRDLEPCFFALQAG